jgi:ribosomal protein S18 acetylase RimI-like enzyme
MTTSIAATLPFASMHVRRLDNGDGPSLQRLLDADPVKNAYLRSELRLGALRSGLWWAALEGREPCGVMVGGPLVVPWVPSPETAAVLAVQLGHQAPPRMIVGPREHVAALQAARMPAPPRPREIREPQPLLTVERGNLRVKGTNLLRRSTRRDLDQLVLAAAAMHREEMGIDPMLIDPAGWRYRMATLVERGWSYLWIEGGEVLFKAELSAWTPDVCQVQGVWTAPARRNRGVATLGMAAMCEALFEQTPTCSLYVNHFNAPALRLYERLGFQQVGEMATYFF